MALLWVYWPFVSCVFVMFEVGTFCSLLEVVAKSVEIKMMLKFLPLKS